MNRTKKAGRIEARRVGRSQAFPIRRSGSSRVNDGHDRWLVVIGICTHLGCIRFRL